MPLDYPAWGLVCIRVPKRNRPIGCIEREKEIYYGELAPTVMEVGKSPDLQSTSWRPRSSQSFSSSLEAGKEQRSSSAVRQKVFLLAGLSVLFMPSTDGMRPTHTGEGNLLSSVHPSKWTSHPETPL